MTASQLFISTCGRPELRDPLALQNYAGFVGGHCHDVEAEVLLTRGAVDLGVS